MGVQSFSEEQLQACGRGHGVTEVEEGVGFLRKAGFNDLSLDIMSGLPGDSVQVTLLGASGGSSWEHCGSS